MKTTIYKPDFLKHKSAIITGAGQGIGRQISIDLARYGSKIILISKNKNHIEITKQKISDNRGNVQGYFIDLEKKIYSLSML